MQELNNVLGFLTGKEIIIGAIIFVVFSYILVALLTWSFHKPLKYLGIPAIVVGFFILLIRLVLPLFIKILLVNTMNIPESLISPLLSPFLNMGLTCLISGIIAIIIYIIIDKLITKISNKQPKEVVVEQQKTN